MEIDLEIKNLFTKLFGKKDDKLECPRCHERLHPLPVCNGDTVKGRKMYLDPEFIHFSCYCGYVFSRCREQIYPDRDYHGAIV